MIGLLTAALADQATHERDRRAASYPGKIAQGADAEALCVDYQCWVAIAEWLETDRFFGFHGGANPERAVTVGEDGRPTKDSPPWISWPELERAAARAIASVRGDNEAALVRRARLTTIHQLIQRRRESIDAINRAFRAPKQELAA